MISSLALDNLEGVARALRAQGNAIWSVANYEKALLCYQEGCQIHRQLGQPAAAALLTGNIGTVHWRVGKHAEALRNYKVALASHRSVGDVYSDLWQARLYLHQERTDEATQLLRLLLVREFRPNMSAIIFEELSAALARKANYASPAPSANPAGLRG